MPGLSLESFVPSAEGFTHLRAAREWSYRAGLAPGRRLVPLYLEDCPWATSRDLFDDLRDAATERPRERAALVGLLLAAQMEGRTQPLASQAARLWRTAAATVDDQSVPLDQIPPRWWVVGETTARHDLQTTWLGGLRTELNPVLERWQDALLDAAGDLGVEDPMPLLADGRAVDLEATQAVADQVLELSGQVYANTLAVYLAQLELPLDDLWLADLRWAWRAPRFDTWFPATSLMASSIRTLRPLGIELEEMSSEVRIRLNASPDAEEGIWTQPLAVPSEVMVGGRVVGGYLDVARLLGAVGQALHRAYTDRTLSFVDRWLGDPSTTYGYGALLAGLTREPRWLTEVQELEAWQDYRVVATLEWLSRVRGAAALVGVQRRLWQAETAHAPASAFEEAVGAAERRRVFPEERLLPLLGAPWTALDAAAQLRGEVFAAQLRAFLRREYDEDWARNPRAGRFLIQELWRPGQRASAEELLRDMGFAGWEPAILWADAQEVLGAV